MKWFKMHGIEFKPGQKYYLDDKYFATTEDPTTYVQTHWKAETARWERQEIIDRALAEAKKTGRLSEIPEEEDYGRQEKGVPMPEIDRRLYAAFKKWGYPLPFSIDEIDKVYRVSDRTIEMDTRTCCMKADRDDMQVWFGKFPEQKEISLSLLGVKSHEKQLAVALLPFETANFKTSRSLLLWCIQNAEITVRLPRVKAIYGVNWLGKRLYEIKPLKKDNRSITFLSKRDDDIFFYELVK